MRSGGSRRDRERAIAENELRHGAEARARYGNEAVDAANERALALTDDEWSKAQTLEHEVISRLRQAMKTGDVGGPDARSLCQAHTRWIELQWGEGTYSRQAHAGLARLYAADERFRAYYDERAGIGATDFLAQALLCYLT